MKAMPREEPKFRRVEVRIDEALYERAKRVCADRAITLSHIVRRGLAWALPVVERDPDVGAPLELSARPPRAEIKAWEPSTSRRVRSREPF